MPIRELIRRREVWMCGLSLVFILLALGTINVAFAVTRIRSRTTPQPPTVENLFGTDAAERGWVVRTPHDGRWPEPTQWTFRRRFGSREYSIHSESPVPDVNGYQLSLQHLGWPLPVIEIRQMWWDWSDPALQGPEPDPRPHLMPLGIVANPVLVGVPVWIVLVVVPLATMVLRRMVRSRGGRCPWCGYDVEHAAFCPECGPGVTGSPR